MQVLVDTSVWIEYFKNGSPDKVDSLIGEDLVVINDVILTELVPVLHIQGKKDLIEGLRALPIKKFDIDWDIIRSYQHLNLKNGINKVGIPDLIILHQVIEENYALYTLDTHFQLMGNLFEFKLM